MSEPPADPSERSHFAALSKDGQRRADELCDHFEAQWQAGHHPRIEDYLQRVPAAEVQALLRELLVLEITYRCQRGETPPPAEYHQRFPILELTWLQRILKMPAGGTDVLTSSKVSTAPPPVLGEYVLLDRLGEGGMGVVYRARHRRMGRIVALKMLHPQSLNAEALRRFEREIRLLARLSHPNIVAAFDAGEQDGVHYLVMEYVDGPNLAALVARDGPLPVVRAVQYILQAAEGLGQAHAQGLVHRDVKPHNLLLTQEGVVKVLDLGLAQLANPVADHGELSLTFRTRTGTVLGTCHFMAPEQARNTSKADHRADIYSLGCTLHYLLTDETIYTGETAMAVFLAHARDPVVSLRQARPDVPPELDRVFQRMVAKQPEQRQQSMTEVSAELRHTIGQQDTAVLSTAAPPQRRIWRIAAIAAGIGLLLLLVVAFFQFPDTSPQPITTAPPNEPEAVTNHLGMRLRRLPAGSYLMGSSPEFIHALVKRTALQPAEVAQLQLEIPVRQVHIERPFFMGVTEVTNAQFEVFTRATGYRTDAERHGTGWGLEANEQWVQGKSYCWRNLGLHPRTPEHPAVSLSWNDALSFCAWLTTEEVRRTGQRVTYRLPTEKEWEYGCRAGNSEPWGSANVEQPGEHAWYKANSGGRLQPVAQKRANAWGLHDMLGNEMEWCLDRYNADPENISRPGDPRDPNSSERRLLRGGAFNKVAELVRPSCRFVSHPASPTHGGFRVVCVVE